MLNKILLMILTLSLSTGAFSTVHLSTVASSNSAPDNEILTAQHAFFQGDTRLAEKLLAGESEYQSLALAQLQVMLWIGREEADKATELLLKLQKRYSSNADYHYFAGGMWRQLGHQVSVCSKIKYYRRAVAAYILAGKLAPDNARYVTKQASVYGQLDMMGGDSKKQRPILAKVQSLNSQYGLVAAMDLAQNEENHKLAAQLAEQAVSQYPNSFLLLVRAAKMHSSPLKNKIKAQQLYAQACQLPAQSGLDRINWISSCYQVEHLAGKTKNFDLVVIAMQRLLAVNQLATSENDQARLYLAQMANEVGQTALAKQQYNLLAIGALDKKLRKKARMKLKDL